MTVSGSLIYAMILDNSLLSRIHCLQLVLTTFSLTASRLPAVDLPQAFRVLAVPLVPTMWLVLPSASFAQADSRARSPRSGRTAVFVSNVDSAHGSCNARAKARGEC